MSKKVLFVNACILAGKNIAPSAQSPPTSPERTLLVKVQLPTASDRAAGAFTSQAVGVAARDWVSNVCVLTTHIAMSRRTPPFAAKYALSVAASKLQVL